MSECRREELVLLVTGDADEARRERLEAHLAACSACREELERQRASWRAVAALGIDTPSAEAMAALRSEMRRAQLRRRKLRVIRIRALRWVGAAAAVLVLAIGWYAINPGPAPEIVGVALDEQLRQIAVDVEELSAETPADEEYLADAGMDMDEEIYYVEQDIDMLRSDW
ncbi:MAG: zf-HC2 domain-containing protein, partial [Planctomycetia bacterium]|nr:zf-HC2 domain-containing protein [Planctomycetia bacterium]